MISSRAIDRFLDRRLKSYDWIKRESNRSLDTAIDELYPRPVFITNPRKHQKECFLIGAHVDAFLYYLGMGSGKTKIALDLIAWRKAAGLLGKPALIVVELEAHIEGWEDEIRIHRPDLKCVPLYGTTNQREIALLDGGDIFIINYAGLNALVTNIEKVEVRTADGGTAEKGRRIIQGGVVEKYAKMFSVFVLDECQNIMNKHSLTFRVCRMISKYAKFKMGLTGTPFGREPLALWSQFFWADRGATLGPTMELFRGAFYREGTDNFGRREWKVRKARLPDLHRLMKNRSIHYAPEEYEKNLPPIVYKNVWVDLPGGVQKYYQSVVDSIIEAKGDYNEMKNSFIRMRMLASGFLGYRADDESERIDIEFNENPKLDALIGLIDQMPADRKMLVFHEFIYSGNKISKELTALGIKHVRLWSGEKNKKGVRGIFRDDPDCRVFVINWKSGATGLNLQMANYVAVYETPVSPIKRQQLEKRAHRDGQEHTTYIFDLMMRDTADKKIKKHLDEGTDFFKAVMAGNFGGIQWKGKSCSGSQKSPNLVTS